MSEYNFIYNPSDNSKHSIFSKTGRNLLKKLIDSYKVGAGYSLDPRLPKIAGMGEIVEVDTCPDNQAGAGYSLDPRLPKIAGMGEIVEVDTCPDNQKGGDYTLNPALPKIAGMGEIVGYKPCNHEPALPKVLNATNEVPQTTEMEGGSKDEDLKEWSHMEIADPIYQEMDEKNKKNTIEINNIKDKVKQLENCIKTNKLCNETNEVLDSGEELVKPISKHKKKFGAERHDDYVKYIESKRMFGEDKDAGTLGGGMVRNPEVTWANLAGIVSEALGVAQNELTATDRINFLSRLDEDVWGNLWDAANDQQKIELLGAISPEEALEFLSNFPGDELQGLFGAISPEVAFNFLQRLWDAANDQQKIELLGAVSPEDALDFLSNFPGDEWQRLWDVSTTIDEWVTMLRMLPTGERVSLIASLTEANEVQSRLSLLQRLPGGVIEQEAPADWANEEDEDVEDEEDYVDRTMAGGFDLFDSAKKAIRKLSGTKKTPTVKVMPELPVAEVIDDGEIPVAEVVREDDPADGHPSDPSNL